MIAGATSFSSIPNSRLNFIGEGRNQVLSDFNTSFGPTEEEKG